MSGLAQRIAKRFRREHRAKKSVDAATPDQFLFKSGHPMAILRPVNPSDVPLKLAAFGAIPAGLPHDAHQAYCGEILDRFPHRFMGYALRDGRIVDEAGNPIGRVDAGDSFVDPPASFRLPDFMVTGRVHDEIWEGRKVVVLPRPDLKADSNTGVVVESSDPTEKGSLVLRAGATEVDCHIPTLNRIWTGDPEKDWRNYGAKGQRLETTAQPEASPDPTSTAQQKEDL